MRRERVRGEEDVFISRWKLGREDAKKVVKTGEFGEVH